MIHKTDPSRRTHCEQIARDLEHDIVTGVLLPGQKLDERGLAERFGSSRTPVREAIRILVARGLVATVANRGAEVAQIAVTEIVEMFEVMAELEGMCAGLAARRMSAEELTDLERFHARCLEYVESVDPDAYYDANVTFHDAIYMGSHNSYLEGQTRFLRRRLSPYRRIQLHQARRISDSYAEHGRILQAIRDRDPDRASAEMKGHVNVQGQSLSDVVMIAGMLNRKLASEGGSAVRSGWTKAGSGNDLP
ncbi:GntR family transcriptional regulator [Paralimibaculum aggregatum]|uniref:GntR family transcriptional regulator n=1 Tax=Paralimibaculum aggregatum TaxID=3036245 RepID=A0ABQ6LTT2_9RHOB|nr:GntR family transcriptional regulator [Limibaculum sp. NKW23]GMG85508.1 GntR family transcriptional regulator [Limibaculum sp. NKW23]